MTALLIYFSSSFPYPSPLSYKRCIFISRSPPSYFMKSIFKHYVNMLNCFAVIFSDSNKSLLEIYFSSNSSERLSLFLFSFRLSQSQSLFTRGTEPSSCFKLFKSSSDEDQAFLTRVKPISKAQKLPGALLSDLGLLVECFPQPERKVNMQFSPASLCLAYFSADSISSFYYCLSALYSMPNSFLIYLFF